MKFFFFIALFIGIAVHAKPVVIVSILPQQTFVQKIGGDKIELTLMVQPGSSPHAYEPKSSQMKALSNAALYLSIGVEFEDVWLKRFQSQNKNLTIVDITQGIDKMHMQAHHHDEHEHAHHEEEEEEADGEDPHTWTSPANVMIMAHNIYKALAAIDAQNESFYKANLEIFLKEIQKTDETIKQILKNTPNGTKFIVFHPSWGYFAKEYSLTQIAVEVEGKSPKPKDLVKIITQAKDEGIKTIFTQPEFSDKSAKIIADESGAKVLKVSPLHPEWSQNLITMAKAIATK